MPQGLCAIVYERLHRRFTQLSAIEMGVNISIHLVVFWALEFISDLLLKQVFPICCTTKFNCGGMKNKKTLKTTTTQKKNCKQSKELFMDKNNAVE